jgi:hypothetical protein
VNGLDELTCQSEDARRPSPPESSYNTESYSQMGSLTPHTHAHTTISIAKNEIPHARTQIHPFQLPKKE